MVFNTIVEFPRWLVLYTHTLDLEARTIAYLTKIYGVRELVATLHQEIRSRVEPRVLVEVYMYLFTCNVCG